MNMNKKKKEKVSFANDAQVGNYVIHYLRLFLLYECANPSGEMAEGHHRHWFCIIHTFKNPRCHFCHNAITMKLDLEYNIADGFNDSKEIQSFEGNSDGKGNGILIDLNIFLSIQFNNHFQSTLRCDAIWWLNQTICNFAKSEIAFF